MSEPIFKLLLIDDDMLIGKAMRLLLPPHWQMTHLTRYQEDLNQHFHVALVDMHLHGDITRPDGIEVVRKLAKLGLTSEIFAISGHMDRDIMEKCLEVGATRFLAKPLKKDELINMLAKIESLVLLQQSKERFSSGYPAFVGTGGVFQNTQKQVASLRGHRSSILIEGETGTGKEVVARLLHLQEDQPRPFIPINMAALPENLFESELFGHVKGAFTGAEQARMGLIEAAHGGDIFFDEIEALPISQQAKLLRFLESGEVRRVGATDSKVVSVRCIFATNQDLQKLVREGKFREDLLWRIKGATVQLAPLRARIEDVVTLATHFLSNIRPVVTKTFAPDAVEAMQKYNWPGNVRELKRLCEQLALVAPLPIIRGTDVERILGLSMSLSEGSMKLDLTAGLEENLRRFERHIFEKALAEIKDPVEIQNALKISRSTYYKKLTELELADNSR